jgi:hypothetical protein
VWVALAKCCTSVGDKCPSTSVVGGTKRVTDTGVQSESARTEQADSEQAVSSKNFKMQSSVLSSSSESRLKKICFHAFRFRQNTARNAAFTNMCVLAPPRMIFIFENSLPIDVHAL